MLQTYYSKDEITPQWVRVWMDYEICSHAPVARIDLSDKELICPKEANRCWAFELNTQKVVS